MISQVNIIIRRKLALENVIRRRRRKTCDLEKCEKCRQVWVSKERQAEAEASESEQQSTSRSIYGSIYHQQSSSPFLLFCRPIKRPAAQAAQHEWGLCTREAQKDQSIHGHQKCNSLVAFSIRVVLHYFSEVCVCVCLYVCVAAVRPARHLPETHPGKSNSSSKQDNIHKHSFSIDNIK